jgi:hypothetical protein
MYVYTIYTRPRSVQTQYADHAILSPCSILMSSLAYSSILKMEDIGSPETSVGFHGTVRFIPQKITLLAVHLFQYSLFDGAEANSQ